MKISRLNVYKSVDYFYLWNRLSELNKIICNKIERAINGYYMYSWCLGAKKGKRSDKKMKINDRSKNRHFLLDVTHSCQDKHEDVFINAIRFDHLLEIYNRYMPSVYTLTQLDYLYYILWCLYVYCNDIAINSKS